MADILSGLVASGFLFKNPAGRFVLGAGAIAFARMAVSSCSLVDTTHYHLELLVGSINETAVIARLDYESMVSVYVDKVESDHSVRVSVPLGLRRRAVCNVCREDHSCSSAKRLNNLHISAQFLSNALRLGPLSIGRQLSASSMR